MVTCTYNLELFSNMLRLFVSQIIGFLLIFFIYAYVKYLKFINVPAKKFFRFKFDSFKNTILIPAGVGVVVAIIFNIFRLTFYPVESTPSIIYFSALIFNGVIVAPFLESIAVQGLFFLTTLSAITYLQRKINRKLSVFKPSKEALATAIIAQAFVFGMNHYSSSPDLFGFFAFKAAYTAIFAAILGLMCWFNDRNLLPVVISHIFYNITLIFSQAFVLC